MTPLQAFQQMDELFDQPSKWTKFAPARDKDGDCVDFDNPNAICWCLNGAKKAVYVSSVLPAR